MVKKKILLTFATPSSLLINFFTMKKYILLSTLILFSTSLFAFQYGRYIGPVSLSLGNVSCVLSDNTYNSVNPATISCGKSKISTFYHNKFLLTEIGLENFSLVYSHPTLSFSANVSHHGFTEYGEISVGVNFSRLFKPYISVGIGAEYLGWYYTGAWHSMACFNLGVMVFPISNLNIGFSVYNLSFSKFKIEESQFEVPTIFYLGLKYKFTELLFLAAEASLSLKENFTASIGLQYFFVKQVGMRIGVYASKEISPCFGLGINLNGFCIDIGTQYNLKLGLTSSLGISYKW